MLTSMTRHAPQSSAAGAARVVASWANKERNAWSEIWRQTMSQPLLVQIAVCDCAQMHR